MRFFEIFATPKFLLVINFYQKSVPSMDLPPADLKRIIYDQFIEFKRLSLFFVKKVIPNRKSPIAMNGFVNGPLPNDIPYPNNQ